MISSFLSHFSTIPDSRVPGLITYPLEELLFSTFIGLLCGAQDWEEITLLATEHLPWLRSYLPFHHGIASVDTYQKVFRALDSEALAQSFVAWVASFQEKWRGVVAVDGKTLRGSKQEKSGKGALHLLSAFAHEAGLVIGQRRVDGKSNEITAIPELLDALMLEGAIVTMDAMGTQREIADKIWEKNADYVLALKGNQGTLHEDVRLFFKEKSNEVTWDACQSVDGDHGRIEVRKCTATADIAWLQARHNWPGLRSIAQVTSHATDKKTGEIHEETRYFLSSLPPDAKVLLAAIRAHWSIENVLHWSLDVTFREDACRSRKDAAALGLATLRHAAFNTLKRNKTKLSMKKKQLKAALNNNFRTELMNC